jgi:hypothetical protein
MSDLQVTHSHGAVARGAVIKLSPLSVRDTAARLSAVVKSDQKAEGVVGRPRTVAVLAHSVGVGMSCLVSYWLITYVLSYAHSVSRADDQLGGMWAVIATVFVYRITYRQSVGAALSRMAATVFSFALCLIYLLLLPFHPLGLAALIGIGTFVLMVMGRDDLVVTTGITTAVVMVVAALSPHDAWQQPILRLVDTLVGVAIGVAAATIGLRVSSRTARGTHDRVTNTTSS